jgi:hypothetical protein
MKDFYVTLALAALSFFLIVAIVMCLVYTVLHEMPYYSDHLIHALFAIFGGWLFVIWCFAGEFINARKQ